MKKIYDDLLIFEKSAIQNLHYSLDEIENTDYYLLMEILGADSEEIKQETVYDNPLDLMNKLTVDGSTD